MRGVRLLVATSLLVPSVALADSRPGQLRLPTSDAAQLAATALLAQLPGFRPDRLLPSSVPGPVVNDEVVLVGLGGDGTVRRVLLDQRLRLTGVGDYAIRERGPARSATSLGGDPPPLTRKGAVVWQGFSPGSRDLAARLVLDPLIEAVHLPLSVTVSYVGSDGHPQPLAAGGRVPGRGIVTVTVRNDTQQPADLPTADDVAASLVAPPLDRALSLARRPSAARLPSTDNGLPAVLRVSGPGQVAAAQAVPFRVAGALTLLDTTGRVTGPASTPTAEGARFVGTLGGVQGVAQVSFTVSTDGPGVLGLDLTAVASLDTRALTPPRGFPTWEAWAASGPPQAERKAALDLLVEVAATGARASSYSPYLGAELAGSGSTTFRYAFAPAEAPVAVRASLHPHWGAIAVASLALLLVLVNAGLIWRRL